MRVVSASPNTTVADGQTGRELQSFIGYCPFVKCMGQGSAFSATAAGRLGAAECAGAAERAEGAARRDAVGWRLSWPRVLNCRVSCALWTPISAPLAGRERGASAGLLDRHRSGAAARRVAGRLRAGRSAGLVWSADNSYRAAARASVPAAVQGLGRPERDGCAVARQWRGPPRPGDARWGGATTNRPDADGHGPRR